MVYTPYTFQIGYSWIVYTILTRKHKFTKDLKWINIFNKFKFTKYLCVAFSLNFKLNYVFTNTTKILIKESPLEIRF